MSAREIRQVEAKERQSALDADVARVAREQNISDTEARRVAIASRRLARRVAKAVSA